MLISMRTLIAFKRPLVTMSAHVRRQATLVFKRGATNLTSLRGFHSNMLLDQMNSDQSLTIESLLADITLEPSFILMLVGGVRAQLTGGVVALATR